MQKNQKKKKTVIVGIAIFVAALQFCGVGRHSSGRFYVLSVSYFSDLALPFAFYFLLLLPEHKAGFLRGKWIKALIIFAAATTAEILQYFGVYALGRSFDPFDILAYALGVTLALVLEMILSKLLPFWESD